MKNFSKDKYRAGSLPRDVTNTQLMYSTSIPVLRLQTRDFFLSMTSAAKGSTISARFLSHVTLVYI